MRDSDIGETTDTSLVAATLGGDLAAYSQLVRRHAPVAKRMAVLWGADDEADDAGAVPESAAIARRHRRPARRPPRRNPRSAAGR